MITSAMRANTTRTQPPSSPVRKREPTKCDLYRNQDRCAHPLGSDRGGHLVEQSAEVCTNRCDSNDDDHCDQGNHEAVLNSGGATVTAQGGDLDLELDETRKHVGPLHRTGITVPERFAQESLSACAKPQGGDIS
jgi:hypothetical protein